MASVCYVSSEAVSHNRRTAHVSWTRRGNGVPSRLSFPFITPAEWMPKKSDVALMGFGIWSILKRRLQKRNIYTMTGLKKVPKHE